MLERIRGLSIDFLHGKIHLDVFVQACTMLYKQSLHNPKRTFELESILVSPFIHEFAYGSLTESEMKTIVGKFYGILSGTQSYQYSVFLRLPPHDNIDQLLIDMHDDLSTIPASTLIACFSERVALPITVYDIIHNAIFDLLAISGVTGFDAEYSLINCDDSVIADQIGQKLVRLLSYLLGKEVLILQVICSPQKGVEYLIL